MYNGDKMSTVTVSQKFQIVIPKDIRRHLNIRPGEKIVVVEKGKTIHMIPVGRIKESRGIAKGASSDNLRDESERFD